MTIDALLERQDKIDDIRIALLVLMALGVFVIIPVAVVSFVRNRAVNWWRRASKKEQEHDYFNDEGK